MPPKMLYFALICRDLPSISDAYFHPSLCHKNPKRSKMWQIDAVNRSKNVVEIAYSYYCDYFVSLLFLILYTISCHTYCVNSQYIQNLTEGVTA